MKFIGTLILGLGSLVVGATKQIHEMLYQLAAKGGYSDTTNPIDDIDDPGDPMTPATIAWWVGGTTILLTVLGFTLFGLGKRGKGKGGALFSKLFKKKRR